MSEPTVKQSETDKLKVILEGIVQSSKKILMSYLLSIVAMIVFVVLAVLAFAGMAVVGVGIIEGEGNGLAAGEIVIEGFSDPMLKLSIAVIFVILVILVILFILPAYIMYNGVKILKSTVESTWDHPAARELDLPVKIMYYSALGILIGLATLIILVGIVILLVASLGWTLGVLLYGLALRKIDPALSTGGTLLIIAVVLQFLTLMPIDVLGVLGLLGFLLELIGFYVVYSDADRLLERMKQEGSPGYTASAQ